MAVAKTKKRKSKVKVYPYISVEGVESKYLDACLLLMLRKEQLLQILEGEPRLQQRAKINLIDIKSKRISREEIVEKLCPIVQEDFDLYNQLVCKWYDTCPPELLEAEKNMEQPTEEWQKFGMKLVENGNLPLYVLLNYFRLCPESKLHHLIERFLARFSDKYYEETKINLPGYYYGEQLEMEGGDVDEEGEISLQGSLELAISILQDLKDNPTFSSDGKYKKKYEQEKEQNQMLKETINELQSQLKSKESTIENNIKEIRSLSKSVENLELKLDRANKEKGKMSESIGEMRKSVDEYSKKNMSLENKVKLLEKQLRSQREETVKKVEQEWRIKCANLKDEYEKRAYEDQATIARLTKQLEELQRTLDEVATASKLSKEEESMDGSEYGTEADLNDFCIDEDDFSDLGSIIAFEPEKH